MNWLPSMDSSGVGLESLYGKEVRMRYLDGFRYIFNKLSLLEDSERREKVTRIIHTYRVRHFNLHLHVTEFEQGMADAALQWV